MKITMKRFILGIALVLVMPLILLARLTNSKGIFDAFATALSLIPGKIGSYIRLGYYMGTLKKITLDVSIGFGSFFSQRSAVVGHNVSIGAYCIIGNAVIKDRVLIASRVSIPSGRRQHGNALNFEHTKIHYDRVTIGNRVWIGEGAIVMADIGDDCIISAGSVVTRAIPDKCVAVGNPARPFQIIRGEKRERSKNSSI